MADNPNNTPKDDAGNEQGAQKRPGNQNKNAGSTDIFIANTVYPDPTAIFTFRLKPIEEMLDDSFFVLDTNTLLVPYTTTQESVQQILKTYTRLKEYDQLRIPAQVAREFANNRPTKLKEMYHQLSTKQNVNISPSKYPLLEGLDKYGRLIELEEELKVRLKEYRKILGELREQIQLWGTSDPVSVLYSDVFTSEIIADHKRVEHDILVDLRRRVAHHLPPGYKDGGKEDDGIGDLLIWYTILELGKERDVVFVTDETKSDWWYRSEKQKIHPRYELIDEFRQASNGKSFHIITLSRLLELYGVDESVVRQVQDDEQRPLYLTDRDGTPLVLAETAMANLREDLRHRYPASLILDDAFRKLAGDAAQHASSSISIAALQRLADEAVKQAASLANQIDWSNINIPDPDMNEDDDSNEE